MKTKDILPKRAADVTNAVKDGWKKDHPRGVWELKVFKDEDEDDSEEQEFKIGYVRKPLRTELSAAMTLKNDPLGQAESIFRDCWLGGDQELLDDEDYFQGAINKFSDLMKVRTAELKKL